MTTGVLLDPHNQPMEPFLILRQLFVGVESAPSSGVPEAREDESAREAQAETSSKLGALLVILAPFAVAAWAAIGFFAYRLLS